MKLFLVLAVAAGGPAARGGEWARLPAPADASGFFILGGDDGAHVGAAPEKHPGFSKTILRYDPKADTWLAAGAVPAPRVTVPCVVWNTSWVVPSGEARPGVRSADVWAFTPGGAK